MTQQFVDVVKFRNQQIEQPTHHDEEPELGFSLNLDFFKNPDNIDLEPEEPAEDAPKKRGRPKKKETAVYVKPEGDDPTYNGDRFIGSTTPYIESYQDTNEMLKYTIGQLDRLGGLLQNQMDYVMNSKTLKNKYKYITDLSMSMSSAVGNKLTAIREVNKSITDSHNLEIRRIKDLKMAEAAGKQDDDKRMQDLYNSFISTPMNMGLGPAVSELSLQNTNSFIPAVPRGYDEDAAYQQYLAGISPEQNRMRYEGNTETVLLYDAMTGSRQFAVVDKSTGEYIPNIPVPSDLILENTNIDTRTGMARNRDINATYRVVQVNGDPSLTHF